MTRELSPLGKSEERDLHLFKPRHAFRMALTHMPRGERYCKIPHFYLRPPPFHNPVMRKGLNATAPFFLPRKVRDAQPDMLMEMS